MLLRTRSWLLLTGLLPAAALTGACAHNVGREVRTAERTRAVVVSSRHPEGPAPVVRPLGGIREGAAVALGEVDGRVIAYVADEDDARIRVVDVDEGRELSSVRPGGIPSQLLVRQDGRLLAALRDTSQVVVLGGGGTETSRLAIEKRVDVASEPVGLALSPDQRRLVVASAWGKKVSILDASTLAGVTEHAVGREPRAVVVSGDGKRVFVSHVVGNDLDVLPLVAGEPTPKPLAMRGTEQVSHTGSTFEQQRAACQGFVLARAESGRVFAPHVLAFTGDASESTDGYGAGSEGREAEVFHVPVIDEDAGKLVAGSMALAAGRQQPGTRAAKCALPRAAAVGKAGLFVTCVGDDVVALYDADAVNPHDVELGRWSVPSGPVGIALDETRARAIVWSQFAHALTTLAIGDGAEGVKRPFALSSLTLARETRASARIERGRALFHATGDTRISSDGRACASCHPDGRDDALVWPSPNGPRQTPLLAGRLTGSAPYGWNGDARDVSSHLTQTFRRLGGAGLPADDKESLMAYVGSLRAPPAKEKDAEAVARGRAIFQSEGAQCSTCHGVGGDLPDGVAHDVKSRATGDRRAAFDTPSLTGVGGSGPWFHDGRFKDLHTLLVKSDGKMGRTKHLSPAEMGDLELYLESL